MTKVWLHYNNTNYGPGGVVRNLKKGLQIHGIDLVKKPNKANYLGCLQDPGTLFTFLPENTLMGPNLFVLPSESPHITKKFNNFVVPSNWVKHLYKRYPEMNDKNIHVWSVGIDTDEWTPSENKPEYDCFVYVKNSSKELLNDTIEQLKVMNQSVGGVLHYGYYNEHNLKELCDKCRYAVLLTDTESQGLAYMEILSTDTPCFVSNQSVWHYTGRSQQVSAPASSVPYFDSKCGQKIVRKDRNILFVDEADHETFLFFLDMLNQGKYNPRGYIIQNHTLSTAAHKYVDILKEIGK